jgi:hemerythrin
MGLLTWNDDYSVHISEVDNEHRLLIELVKDLDSALETQEMVRSQLVSSALVKFTHAITAHFESEERFLLINKYPDFKSHQKEHHDLLQTLEQFVGQVCSKQAVFSEENLLFLKDWLVRHIILHDSKFGSFYRDKELAAWKS